MDKKVPIYDSMSLLSLVSNDRMCGNGTKLCQGTFRLDNRKKKVFTVRTDKHFCHAFSQGC